MQDVEVNPEPLSVNLRNPSEASSSGFLLSGNSHTYLYNRANTNSKLKIPLNLRGRNTKWRIPPDLITSIWNRTKDGIKFKCPWTGDRVKEKNPYWCGIEWVTVQERFHFRYNSESVLKCDVYVLNWINIVLFAEIRCKVKPISNSVSLSFICLILQH